jgi:hypothetical protein
MLRKIYPESLLEFRWGRIGMEGYEYRVKEWREVLLIGGYVSGDNPGELYYLMNLN